MPFDNGENVGAYRILAKLGQGGVATVYKAYHPALDRLVAIKVLHPAFKEDPNFLERFRREARVIAKLEHTNIVPIYDFSEHHDQPYLVMKYIEGETLKARLARSPLDIIEGLRIVEAVGSGLAHAHRKGVLHRDVKPSNILLDDDSGIYLADFGLARIAAAGESTLSSDMLMGTPQYISPEQAQGERDLDARTDIYSFGVVLYEIVVGRVPFQADTPFSIIHDHIYTPLPLPSRVNPQVPAAVELVLLKALAKKRDDRFDDVESMVAAFRTACSGGDPGIVDIPPAEKTAMNAAGAKQRNARLVDERAGIPGSPHISPGTGNKSAKRWIWLAVGIVIACISGLALLSILNPGNQPAASESAVLSPEAAAAQEVALEEAGIYIDNGEAVREAELLAEDAFRHADQGMFLQAANTFLRVLEIENLPEDRVSLYREQLYHMLYLAAGQQNPDLLVVIEEARQRYSEFLDLLPVELRYKLFMEGADHVLAEVTALVERQPENAVYRLLRAETRMEINDAPGFQEDIDFLFSEEKVPDWIRNHATFLKDKFAEQNNL